MPFNVVFDIAHDQQRVLLEHSKLQGVGNADLFRNRFLARASHPMEQISSRLCALSALFTLFSHQACASDLSPMPYRGSLGNSTILFSSTKGAVAILLVSFVRSPATWSTKVATDQGRGGVDSKTAHSAMATPATFSLASLIAETNAECTRSANEISVGTHDFDLAYSVTNLNCADMRSGERNHFSKLTGSN